MDSSHNKPGPSNAEDNMELDLLMQQICRELILLIDEDDKDPKNFNLSDLDAVVPEVQNTSAEGNWSSDMSNSYCVDWDPMLMPKSTMKDMKESFEEKTEEFAPKTEPIVYRRPFETLRQSCEMRRRLTEPCDQVVCSTPLVEENTNPISWHHIGSRRKLDMGVEHSIPVDTFFRSFAMGSSQNAYSPVPDPFHHYRTPLFQFNNNVLPMNLSFYGNNSFWNNLDIE